MRMYSGNLAEMWTETHVFREIEYLPGNFFRSRYFETSLTNFFRGQPQGQRSEEGPAQPESTSMENDGKFSKSCAVCTEKWRKLHQLICLTHSFKREWVVDVPASWSWVHR